MINSFRKEMTGWSFTRHNQRSFVRKNGNLCWWVQEIPLSKQDPKVRILIGIGIDDPFREDRGFGLACLTGDIEPGQVCFHFDETPYWWNESEVEDVRSVLEECGRSVFDYWAESELIRYFEKPLANVAFARGAAKNAPLIDRTQVTRNPPINQHWLALLHYHQRNFSRSIICAEQWLEHVKHLRDGGIEPQRTLNQIAELRARMDAARPRYSQ